MAAAEPSRQTLEEIPSRALAFLRGAGNSPDIRSVLVASALVTAFLALVGGFLVSRMKFVPLLLTVLLSANSAQAFQWRLATDCTQSDVMLLDKYLPVVDAANRAAIKYTAAILFSRRRRNMRTGWFATLALVGLGLAAAARADGSPAPSCTLSLRAASPASAAGRQGPLAVVIRINNPGTRPIRIARKNAPWFSVDAPTGQPPLAPCRLVEPSATGATGRRFNQPCAAVSPPSLHLVPREGQPALRFLPGVVTAHRIDGLPYRDDELLTIPAGATMDSPPLVLSDWWAIPKEGIARVSALIQIIGEQPALITCEAATP